MSKLPSPIRLDPNLMREAASASALSQRTVPEQIAYWARLGRTVAGKVSPNDLLKLTAGIASLEVVPRDSGPVDADDVFAGIEKQRDSGTLSAQVTTSRVRYQASVSHPGWLERVDEYGNITLGQFHQGEFLVKGDE